MNNPDQDMLIRALEDARRVLGEYIEPGPRHPPKVIPYVTKQDILQKVPKGGTEGVRPIAATGEAEMKAADTKATESKCPGINGTGYPVVTPASAAHSVGHDPHGK